MGTEYRILLALDRICTEYEQSTPTPNQSQKLYLRYKVAALKAKSSSPDIMYIADQLLEKINSLAVV